MWSFFINWPGPTRYSDLVPIHNRVTFFLKEHPHFPRRGMAATINAGYSHLFNKHGGGAKVAKSLNVEAGINVEGGIFRKN